MKYRQSLIFACYLLFALCTNLSAQVASRSDGVNVFYYDSIFEAMAAASAGSFDQPDEITLLADFVLDEPLIVDDGVHIRLVAGGSDRTIRRSGNLMEYPVVWVRGDGASLSLGKPGMEHELIVDGGYLNSPPIEAHAPLAAVSGPGAKLIMYDNVALQNNINNGNFETTSHYQNGAGVYICTQGDITNRQAEFIMKGGTIRGNKNDVQSPLASGGGVFITALGIFTMEGGVIMNNTAQLSGGGFYTTNRGSFKKTGGIIYGSNAPAAYRNTALTSLGTPKNYGHAIGITAIYEVLLGFRNDTVAENDNLSYIGSLVYGANGTFGRGEKWDNPDKAFWRMLLVIVLPVLALAVCAIVILRKRYLKKLMKIVDEAADQSAKANPKIDLENMDLSGREKDICELLLTNRTLKEIGQILNLTYSGANFHAQKLYAKLGIEGRTELLVRVKKNES